MTSHRRSPPFPRLGPGNQGLASAGDRCGHGGFPAPRPSAAAALFLCGWKAASCRVEHLCRFLLPCDRHMSSIGAGHGAAPYKACVAGGWESLLNRNADQQPGLPSPGTLGVFRHPTHRTVYGCWIPCWRTRRSPLLTHALQGGLGPLLRVLGPEEYPSDKGGVRPWAGGGVGREHSVGARSSPAERDREPTWDTSGYNLSS